MAIFTHEIVVRFYLKKPPGVETEREIRAWVGGYLREKLPELDIENITVKEIGGE